MIKKILKISVLMLALLPTLVFAKDLDNQDIEVGMYFKSGDVIKNLTNVTSYHGYNASGDLVSKSTYFDFYKIGETDYPVYERYEYYNSLYYDDESGIAMPTINDKNIIWQVKEVNNTPIGKIDGKDYYDEYGVVFIEADYPAPTLSIKCDSDTIKVGSSAVCSLYINNQMELQTVDMTIESNIFDIDDIVPAIGWSFKKNTDGSVKVSYVKPIINKASEDEENLGIKIIDFKATATEDVDTETLNGSVEAKNIEYEDEFVTRNLDTVKTEIEIEQEEQKEQEEVKQEEVKQEEETEKV